MGGLEFIHLCLLPPAKMRPGAQVHARKRNLDELEVVVSNHMFEEFVKEILTPQLNEKQAEEETRKNRHVLSGPKE